MSFSSAIHDYRVTNDELQLLELFENNVAKQIVEEIALIYITDYIDQRF